MFFSKYFSLIEPQNGYEFVDIDVFHDTKKFVDPYLIQRDKTAIGLKMTASLLGFMSRVLDAVRNNEYNLCFSLCNHFKETKGTMLGYSKVNRDGRGAGNHKCRQFVDSLFNSYAVTSGAVKYLEECSLVCDNIDKDGISDITIAIVRKQLIEFTQEICRKYNIPMKRTKEKLQYYCNVSKQWQRDYFDLPHVTDTKNNNEHYVILIPKHFVPLKMTYSSKYFFTNIATDYFKEQALQENHPSVIRLKNGTFKVKVKELRLDSRFMGHKPKMAEFINNHPESLAKYRSEVADYIYKSQS